VNYDTDTLAGATAAAGGSGALTLQLATQYANFGVTVLNIILAVGGLYLMWPKIKKVWRDRRSR
jgi:uncharacterized iron-regulated membrane protein